MLAFDYLCNLDGIEAIYYVIWPVIRYFLCNSGPINYTFGLLYYAIHRFIITYPRRSAIPDSGKFSGVTRLVIETQRTWDSLSGSKFPMEKGVII